MVFLMVGKSGALSLHPKITMAKSSEINNLIKEGIIFNFYLIVVLSFKI
jgi:hypothetical protein